MTSPPFPVPGRYDAVVVGAGISGLTAAFRLAQAGRTVAVLETTGRVGGAITTLRQEGWLFELGPNTVLASRPAVDEVIAAAGLAGERLTADPAAKRRYLWKGDRLHPLPAGPGSFFSTPLFPLAAKLRLLREPWVRQAPAEAEESIAGFVRRRLGPAFLDYAVGPFVSGVYAGDPERLSVRWAVPRIHALERDHGSLIRGALARRRAARGASSAESGGPAAPRGTMISFHDGLETLPRRLADAIGAVRTGCPVRSIDHGTDGWVAETAAGTFCAPHLVMAVPADATAELLAGVTEGGSRAFAGIPYAPVAVACLGFRRADVAHPLDGFGFLAPRCESLRALGGLFPSTIFPGRAPAGHVALVAFAGGRTDPELVAADEAEILASLLADLDRALGLRGEPVFRHLARWPRAIPQFELGHGRFVELARDLERRHPGLHLAGNAFTGVSVPDCMQGASDLAGTILAAG